MVCMKCTAYGYCARCGTRCAKSERTRRGICSICSYGSKTLRTFHGNRARKLLASMYRMNDGLFTECDSHSPEFIASLIRDASVPNCVKQHIARRSPEWKTSKRRETKKRQCMRGLLQLDGHARMQTKRLVGWTTPPQFHNRWFAHDVPCIVCLGWKSRDVSQRSSALKCKSTLPVETFFARPVREAFDEAMRRASLAARPPTRRLEVQRQTTGNLRRPRGSLPAVHKTITKTHCATGRPTDCLLYTSPSPRDQRGSRMPSSA